MYVGVAHGKARGRGLVGRHGASGARRGLLDKYTVVIYHVGMDSMPAAIWIDAVAHRLHRHWRTVDAEQLEEVATDLWRDPRLREMNPAEAAIAWLGPLADVPRPPS